MDHRYIVTAKVRNRKQFPGTSLREFQMLEDLYGIQPFRFDLQSVLARNNAFSPDVYFPLESKKLLKK